jgi:hypothetical protein
MILDLRSRLYTTAQPTSFLLSLGYRRLGTTHPSQVGSVREGKVSRITPQRVLASKLADNLDWIPRNCILV